MSHKVPFMTPVDYFLGPMRGCKEGIEEFPAFIKNQKNWAFDTDLHVYPYTDAVPAALSMGCAGKCFFCPTAETHKGNIVLGDPDKIIPQLSLLRVHFMDEDFFRNNKARLKEVLAALKKGKVIWLAMTTSSAFSEALEEFGEEYLYGCGLRVVEMGLENVALFRKVGVVPLKLNRIQIYYLNLSLLPGETKGTIRENAEWMRNRGLVHPIHHSNGTYFGPGQFYHPYGETAQKGKLIPGDVCRVLPSFLPDSFSQEPLVIKDLEVVNYFSQLAFGFKQYPLADKGYVSFFLEVHKNDVQRMLAWLVLGVRTGGIQ